MKILSGMLGTVAAIALLAGPALAQGGPARYGEPDKTKTPAEIAAEKDAERAYRRSLSNVPEQKASDPWGIARESAPANAAKASPAKPKANKTDSRSADTKPGNTAK
jgi:hypothetical protein